MRNRFGATTKVLSPFSAHERRDHDTYSLLFSSILVLFLFGDFILSTAVVCILVLVYTVLYRELERACCTGDLRSWVWSNRKRELECTYAYEFLLLGYLEHAGTCIQAFLEAPHVSHFSINEHMPIINSEYRRAARSVTKRYWDGGLGVPAGIGSSEP